MGLTSTSLRAGSGESRHERNLEALLPFHPCALAAPLSCSSHAAVPRPVASCVGLALCAAPLAPLSVVLSRWILPSGCAPCGRLSFWDPRGFGQGYVQLSPSPLQSCSCRCFCLLLPCCFRGPLPPVCVCASRHCIYGCDVWPVCGVFVAGPVRDRHKCQHRLRDHPHLR